MTPFEELRGRLIEMFNTGDPASLLDPSVVAQAAELGQRAEQRPGELLLLGLVHWYRGIALPLAEADDDLIAAVTVFERLGGDMPGPIHIALSAGTELTPGTGTDPGDDEDQGDELDHADRLAGVLLRYGQRTGEARYLDQAVRLLKRLAQSATDDERPRDYANLAIGLRTRYERSGNISDLSESVQTARQAVELTPTDSPERANRLLTLGYALQDTFELTDALPDLDAAVEAIQSSVTATPIGDPIRAARLSGLGNVLLTRAERTGSEQDLEEAIAACQASVDLHDAAASAACWTNLGNALLARTERTGSAQDLHHAVEAHRAAVELASADERPPCLSNLGDALALRFERARDVVDLNAAIEAGATAVELLPADHPLRIVALSNLSALYHTRFRQTGDPADLDSAIDLARSAVEATPNPRSSGLTHLGSALLTRFQRTGRMADLDDAVAAAHDAVHALPAGHPDLPACLSNLGNVLKVRFERTGMADDLDTAIAAGRSAVAATRSDDPSRANFLSNFGNTLQTRHEAIGALADLDEAIAACEAAARAALDDSERPGYLCNLGTALLTRFEATGQRADLDAAVDAHYAAVEACESDSPYRATLLSNVCLALRHRFEAGGDSADLMGAITAGRQAVQLMSDQNPERADVLDNLGLALLTEAESCADEAAVAAFGAAIDTLAAALAATPKDHPSSAGRLLNLGGALYARYALTKSVDDLAAASARFQAGAEVETSPVWHRGQCARGWGDAAGQAGDWNTSTVAYRLALELVERMTDRSLHRRDQEWHLVRLPGLGCDAAAVELHRDHADQALAMLEQGRCVLLGRSLLARSELDRLSESHPALAERLAAIDRELDLDLDHDTTTPADVPAMVDRRHRLAVDRHEILADIRSREGFEQFQLPPTDELTRVRGPVVAVNVSSHRSDALILAEGGVEQVRLDGVTEDELAEQTRRLQHAVDLNRGGTRADMLKVLGWLWDTIAEPVLQVLLSHSAGRPQSAELPRVWWLPTGQLVFHPLHAAGHYRGSALVSAMDSVVSSYIPSIRALVHRGGRPDVVRPGPDSVVVGVRHTAVPGQRDLLEAEAEATAIASLLGTDVLLTGVNATRDSFLAAMPSARCAHLACHALGDAAEPSRSSLLLSDQALRVAEISGLHLTKAELAYLSACGTARGDERLPDEAVHLSAAFLLAGFTHVIGSLWSVPDDLARQTAVTVYTGLSRELPVARAVHQSARRSRDAEPEANPRLWAGLVHLGP